MHVFGQYNKAPCSRKIAARKSSDSNLNPHGTMLSPSTPELLKTCFRRNAGHFSSEIQTLSPTAHFCTARINMTLGHHKRCPSTCFYRSLCISIAKQGQKTVPQKEKKKRKSSLSGRNQRSNSVSEWIWCASVFVISICVLSHVHIQNLSS